jgi:lipoprotein YgeR
MSIRLRLLVPFLVVFFVGCSPPCGIYHPVTAGQTLYRISRAYGVETDHLARLNGIGDPSKLRAGQRLFIPGAVQVKAVRATVAGKTSAAPLKTRRPDRTAAASKQKLKAGRKPKPRSQVAKKPPSHAKGMFIYPVKGEIIRQFGGKSGQINRGVEFAVRLNGTVLSAAAGRVIYSGDGVKGYGNLIILKHERSFYTVYGFNSKNLVPTGTYVSRGQKIALCGVPPGGGRPRLHFEIRHGKDAVNPIFYLP